MSMEHKAFVFDYDGFLAGPVRPLLEQALVDGDCTPLRGYLDAHAGELTDPFEGEPLGPGWDRLSQGYDAHNWADYALTHYYDASDDIGLGYDWHEAGEQAAAVLGGDADQTALGVPFGPADNPFDPGRMGSYFRSPAAVRADLDRLTAALPAPEGPVADLIAMLRAAEQAGAGLYITF